MTSPIKGTHKSIYLPPKLAAKLLANESKINFSRVCRSALEKALDDTDDDGINIGTVMKELHDKEEEIRQLKAVLQGLVRHAASYCGMTVLTGKDEEAFKQVFENGVESFIYQTKKSALEEAKIKKTRIQKSSKKKNATSESDETPNKADRLTILETTETAIYPKNVSPSSKNIETACSICSNNTGDVHCEGDECQNMICWFCWGDLEAEMAGEPKLCLSCRSKKGHTP